MTGELSFIPNTVEGSFLVRTHAHGDARGSFGRIFCEDAFRGAGLPIHFPQHNISHNSYALTLRGLHYQSPASQEHKLVRCVQGRIWDVVADIRKTSSTYGKWWATTLEGKGNDALFIPAGCAHGFITLTDNSTVLYHMGESYTPETQAGVKYDDPMLNIAWPATPAHLSPRDGALPFLGAQP